MRAIVYKTGVDCIGKLNGYFIFHNYINGTFGVVKDDGTDNDVIPPHCGYYELASLLKLKNIPANKIREFVAKFERESK